MAFPTVAATNSGNSGGNATTHVINMPSGATTGDLVIVGFTNDGSATVSVNSGTNWTQVFTTANGTAARLTVYRKILDGTGDNLTLATSASEGSAHVSYRITNFNALTVPAFGTAATGTSANPNPPSLNPASWDVEDTLWIVVYGWDGNVSHTTYPTNYASNQVTDRWANANGCGIAIATFNNAAASEDPGTATIGSDDWIAQTMGVRPKSYAFGQTQARIKAVGQGFGQSQADIKQTYTDKTGQPQADIKQTYNVHGQANALIVGFRGGLGQANADIKQTYPLCTGGGTGDAAILGSDTAILGSMVLGSSSESGGEQTCIGAFGQAQAEIKPPAYNAHGQAQADIKQTYFGLGQSQAWIENTYNGHGQAQAFIIYKQNGLGQAQARIKTTYFALGQAQGMVEGTAVRFGQAQADIKQTYPLCYFIEGTGGGAILGSDTAILGDIVLGSSEGAEEEICVGAFGQAQAEIISQAAKYAHGQAQARIKQTYYVHGQAQAWIENTYNGHGQAQAWVENTYNGHGQAQGTVKTTYYVHGQAQALIGTLNQVYGQAQADIKAVGYGYGQAQGQIKTTYRGHGQAQGQIKTTYYAFGQAQGTITRFVGVPGQAQATIIPQYIHFLDTFTRSVDPITDKTNMNPPDVGLYSGNTFISGNGRIDGSKAIVDYRDFFATRFVGNAAIDIVGDSTLSMQFRLTDYVSIDDFYFEVSINEPGVTNGAIGMYTDSGEIVLFGGTNLVSAPFVPVNGVTYKFLLYAGHTVSRAKWWAASDPEPSGWNLTVTPNVSFVAISAFFWNEVFGPLGETMEIDNLSVYAPEPPAFLGFGQAQASISRTMAWGQAQARIKQTTNRHGQAQAFIRKSAGRGQAQALIVKGSTKSGQAQAIITNTKPTGQAQAFINTTRPTGQAQAYIMTTSFPVGQAQAHILQKQWIMGQAQAQIRAFGFIVSGQAQGLITGNKHNVYGQAMANIESISNAFGQAQALVVKNRGFGQAQAQIKLVTRAYGQAQAYIIRRMGFGQAQGYVRKGTETRVFGQAQAFIEYINIGTGQAQALIRKGTAAGQAQARIKAFGQFGPGHTQAYIRRTDTNIKSGQAMGQIKRSDPVGQAQALISGGRYLVKYHGYQLPGYAQVEDLQSPMGIEEHDAAYQFGPFSEYVGLKNKTLSLTMKVVGNTYLGVKDQVQEAATIVRSSKGWTKLYVHYYDRYYTAMNDHIRTNKSVGSTMRMLDYDLEFEAKPWLTSDTVHTISGAGLVSTILRDIYNGGWTPTRVRVSGTDVTISGYNEYGEFTGFVSISGVVTNMVIDAEDYTSTINGINSNNQMENPDYALYVGPGTTYFDINGATECVIEYQDRWYL